MGVIIKEINVKNNRISAEVFVEGEKNDVWYEFPWNMEKIALRPANAFLVAFMPIAMRFGGKFEIDGEISQNLYNQMDTYQDIMKKWHSELKKVEICPKEIKEDIQHNKKRKVISCFTGGVDAFYTLLKNDKKIDELLYVWGFDIPLTEPSFYNKVKEHLSTVANEFSKPIVLVKTNLGFEVTNKYASWGEFCYGAAIASVILFMTDKYEVCYMPSGNDYSVLVPRGSHPLINPLWGCDGVKFIYDGAESARVEKVERIADNEIVQKHLRVCYESNNSYNCSECEKCIRTMASLEALDKLKNIKTFCKPLILENINKVKFNNYTEMKLAEATMNVAIKNKKNELANQLNEQINNYKITDLIQELNKNIDKLMEKEEFYETTKKIVDWHIEHDTKRISKKSLKVIIRKIKNKIKFWK